MCSRKICAVYVYLIYSRAVQKVIASVRYFWHGYIHRCTTFMYLQYNRPPLFITFCQMFGRRRTPSARPSLMFRIDRPMDRISSSLGLYVPGLSLWLFHYGEDIVIAWTQEKMTIFGGTEPHHSSRQCKESHRCCCNGLLAQLAMGDSGTSTVLTQWESMWLRFLCQRERTTARDPVQHKDGQYGTSTKMDTLMVYDTFWTFGKRW